MLQSTVEIILILASSLCSSVTHDNPSHKSFTEKTSTYKVYKAEIPLKGKNKDVRYKTVPTEWQFVADETI